MAATSRVDWLRRRAVLEGRDELALDGIDRQPEPLERVGAQYVEIARIAEEADRVQGASLEGDEHFRGVALGDLALDRHHTPSFGGRHRQRTEEGGADPGVGGTAVHEQLDRLTALGSLRRGELRLHE